MFHWDDENKAKLNAMVAQNVPFRQIAEAFGVTKNAISGAVWRYVHGRTSRAKRPTPDKIVKLPKMPKRRGGHQNASVARVDIPPSLPPREGPGVYLMDLGHFHCRYPLEAQWMYCGEPTTKKSYCAHHAAICYRPIQPTRPSEGFRIRAWSKSCA